MENRKYLKRAATGTIFVFLFGILTAFFGYLLRLVLTANLTPAEYGLYYSCLSLIGLFALFKDFGLNQSLVYHISKFRTERKLKKLRSSVFTVLFIQSIPALIISIIIFLCADFLVLNYLHLSENLLAGAFVIKFLAIVYFIQIFYGIILSILQGFQKMKFFAIADFCRMVFYFAFTLLFISLNFAVLSPALGFLLSYILSVALFSPFVAKLIPKAKFSFSKELTKKLIFYGFPIMLSGAAGLIIGYTDTILITLFKSLEEVGIYQTAQPTARLLWFFSGALASVLFPMVTELKTKKDGTLEKGISLIYRYVWVALIPFALMAFAFSKEILNLFFGSFYARGSLVLKILAIGAIFYSVAQINGVALNGIGKPQNFTKIVYLGAIANLIGNLLLIPIVGIAGAAISTLLTYFIMFCFSFFELKKFIKLELPLAEWIKTLFAGFVALLSIYLLKNLLATNVFLEVFICFSLSISLFFCLLIALKVIDLNEILKLARQIIKK